MKYGLPYKGSKNKLAERIVRLLPKRTHLVDLFCGGCAVSHAAMVMKKYEHIHINDLNWMCPTLFIDALSGKYNNETRWISREDFFRLRDTDPYVAVVWSFGNNLRDYLYSQEIEPLKKAIHYAMFFSDYSLGRELGHDLSFIDPIKDIQQRYLAVKRYFSQYGHFQQETFERGGRYKSSTLLGRNGSAIYGGSPCGCSQPKPQRGSATILEQGGKAPSDWKRQKDCSISLGISSIGTNNGGGMESSGPQNCNTWNVSDGCSSFKKKICKRPWEAEHRERANSVAQIAVPGATAQSARPVRTGGGNRYPLRAVCLTMPRWRYPRTA